MASVDVKWQDDEKVRGKMSSDTKTKREIVETYEGGMILYPARRMGT